MTLKRSRSSSSLAGLNAPKRPSVERAEQVDNDPPFEQLRSKLYQSDAGSKPSRTVVHWFRNQDLRIEDNRGLSQASALASKYKDKGSKLVAIFVVEPSVYDSHGVGAARLAFIIRSLQKLEAGLRNLGIPLVPILAENRAARKRKLTKFFTDHDVTHVFANWEYEFDELQRDIEIADVLAKQRIAFKLEHDQTAVAPGDVVNAAGNPLRVFTPFWHAWTPMLSKDPKKYYLNLADPPQKQDTKAIDGLFEKFSEFDFEDALGVDMDDSHIKRVSQLWPAGHEAAVERLDQFIKHKIHRYGASRNYPAEDCTSRMSVYFATGNISVREALSIVRRRSNNDNNFGTSSSGVDSWVREIAFREFYRQMTATSLPHVVMNMPTSLKLAEVRTEQDDEGWKRWCEGRTGYPFIDAGMRQLNHEGYMHNRLRMNVSSFLRMNLLIDYRKGAEYFANKLVDWDPSNNAFGWDPNYTVFNPVIQGEKNDRDGEYIRKWVPELKNVPGKALFDPANRLSSSEFKQLDYPRPQMDFMEAKTRATERFKEASKRMKTEDD